MFKPLLKLRGCCVLCKSNNNFIYGTKEDSDILLWEIIIFQRTFLAILSGLGYWQIKWLKFVLTCCISSYITVSVSFGVQTWRAFIRRHMLCNLSLPSLLPRLCTCFLHCSVTKTCFVYHNTILNTSCCAELCFGCRKHSFRSQRLIVTRVLHLIPSALIGLMGRIPHYKPLMVLLVAWLGLFCHM